MQTNFLDIWSLSVGSDLVAVDTQYARFRTSVFCRGAPLLVKLLFINEDWNMSAKKSYSRVIDRLSLKQGLVMLWAGSL